MRTTVELHSNLKKGASGTFFRMLLSYLRPRSTAGVKQRVDVFA